MRLFTKEQHIEILQRHRTSKAAQQEYWMRSGKAISERTVRYWRNIFLENAGNLVATDRALASERVLLSPQPDDDIGSTTIPLVAERILVIPDMHAPYHHPDTLDFLSAVKDRFTPDLGVCLGDEVDNHALSFHDSDPNLDSAGTELERSKQFLAVLHTMFPELLLCHSNHGSMVYRRAKAHGIPVQMIKRYRDILAPDTGVPGWSWAYSWKVDTALGPVMFKQCATADTSQASK